MGTIDVQISSHHPPVAHASTRGLSAADWLAEHHVVLAELIARYGVVMVRGLGVHDVDAAASVIGRLGGRPMTEYEPFAPRREFGSGLASSSEWPPYQPMCMHNELSYALEFPARQVFCCLEAPAAGGATAIAAGTAVQRDVPADLRGKVEHAGWELARTYNAVVGVDWKTAFCAGERDEVEAYCSDHEIAWTWDEQGGLITRRRLSGIVRHPVSGRPTWFNQMAFLNEWTMGETVRDYLVSEFGADGLPFTTRFGDGEPLDVATVDLINEVYAAHTVQEPWQNGDVLIVDNIRMAHSREPYRGTRSVVVALMDPVRRFAPMSELCYPSRDAGYADEQSARQPSPVPW
jgi:hypothetical protein